MSGRYEIGSLCIKKENKLQILHRYDFKSPMELVKCCDKMTKVKWVRGLQT